MVTRDPDDITVYNWKNRNRGISVLGRMGEGGDLDINEFDPLPTNEVTLTEEDVQESELFLGEDEEAPPRFESVQESFPVLSSALSYFKSHARKPRVVRIDTDDTYGDFVCEQAVRELERRVDDLERGMAAHERDPEAHGLARIRSKGAAAETVDVLGAARTVQKITAAKSPKEAAAAMPQVPVDVPPFAEGKIRCWKDGENVVCSVRFQAADGSPRVATMTAVPKVDVPSIVGWAKAAGVNPTVVLGAAGDMADSVTGKRLVRDTADAAFSACRRADVLGMEEDGEPLVMATSGDESEATASALAAVQEAADSGSVQAQSEMAAVEEAAVTPVGQEVLAPVLRSARLKKVSMGKRVGGQGQRLAAQYADWSMML